MAVVRMGSLRLDGEAQADELRTENPNGPMRLYAAVSVVDRAISPL